MIEREILDIIADKNDDGDRLNEVADKFRRGLDVNHLLALLDSNNPELVSSGAWILGELPFELYNTQSFISRLYELTNHKTPIVRFQALCALYPALNGEEAITQTLLKKMNQDPNEGVRRTAQAAAENLSLKLK